jgi:hypothetical protein
MLPSFADGIVSRTRTKGAVPNCAHAMITFVDDLFISDVPILSAGISIVFFLLLPAIMTTTDITITTIGWR